MTTGVGLPVCHHVSWKTHDLCFVQLSSERLAISTGQTRSCEGVRPAGQVGACCLLTLFRAFLPDTNQVGRLVAPTSLARD